MAAAIQPTSSVVLIVDDDKPIADFVAAVVAEEGYMPLVATRGQQALEVTRDQWPALVITDLMLPFMSGSALITALRAVAAQEQRPMPPVIVMSAASRRYAEAVSADAVLLKPFELTELEALLRQLLGTPHVG